MLRQIRRFGLVGLFATTIHVSVASGAEAVASLTPQYANAAGFMAAFLFSYFGHLRYTFEKKEHARIYLLRFISLSVFSLFFSSAIVYVVTQKLGQNFVWALAVVAVLVPTTTFIIAKFWAFSSIKPQRDHLGPS